jgi:hypothetical protein
MRIAAHASRHSLAAGGGRASRLAFGMALGLALVPPMGAAATDVEWPELKPGLWQFTRTSTTAGKPTTIERQGCADPVAEWKKQQEASGRSGCTMKTVKASADRYVTTAECKLPGAGEGSSRSTAVIKGPGAYEVSVENRGVLAKSGESEHLVAKRLGDCPK